MVEELYLEENAQIKFHDKSCALDEISLALVVAS